ncbi:MAG: hypothetical protein R3F55_10405 [Alphaproteobacteria bacterium]
MTMRGDTTARLAFVAVALGALAGCGGGSDIGALQASGRAVGDAYMQANVTGAAYSPSANDAFSPAQPGLVPMGAQPAQSMPLSQAIELAERPTGEMFVHDIPGRKLSSGEIQQVASGNTMVGPRLSVHYRSDGSAEMEILNRHFEGNWRVSGNDMMCHNFPSFAPWSGSDVCYEWYLDGNRLSTYEPVTGAGATKGENVLVAGNRVR